MTQVLSIADREALHAKFSKGGYKWDALTTDERWRYHAYDYGFRQMYGYGRPSPIDRDGKWYNKALADQAERLERP